MKLNFSIKCRCYRTSYPIHLLLRFIHSLPLYTYIPYLLSPLTIYTPYPITHLQYEAIDDEHKGLFVGIFDMAASPAEQSKVDTLVKAVVEHFTNEEVLRACYDVTHVYCDVIYVLHNLYTIVVYYMM